MKSIVLIIPFFGKWPLWFPANLVSCASNPTIDWLFYTDCEPLVDVPKNVKFVSSTFEEVKTLFAKKFDLPITLDQPYKLCDFKPSYGHVFEEDIRDYDFWGFTDIDIVWGDIRSFITNDLLENYDIITTRKELIAGHFTLFNNNSEKIKYLYQDGDLYKNAFKPSKMMRFCEGTFSDILKNNIGKTDVRVYWEKFLVNHKNGKAHQEYYLDKWVWKDARMINTYSQEEVMYLHFINWKRSMKYCEIKYTEEPEEFYISYNGMHFNKHSTFEKTLNGFKNLFDGYWVREKRRLRKYRFQSFIKRAKRKLKS